MEQLRTEIVELDQGFEFGGTFHKEVTFREEILKDNFREAVEIEENFGKDSLQLTEEEKDSEIVKACVQFRRRIVKIGKISEEDMKKITAKDYFEKLSSEDYMILLGTKVRIDKRLGEALQGAASPKKAASDSKEESSKKN